MHWPEPSERDRGQSHANSESGTAKEPHANANCNLPTARVGKARAQPVKEPYLHKVAPEGRPEHQ